MCLDPVYGNCGRTSSSLESTKKFGNCAKCGIELIGTCSYCDDSTCKGCSSCCEKSYESMKRLTTWLCCFSVHRE